MQNFTGKEIELAKHLNNTGLEWVPAVGDWFYVETDTETGEEIEDWFLCCDVIEYHNQSKCTLYSWNMIGMSEFDCCDCIWLPTLQQCVDEIKHYVEPIVYVKSNQVVVPGRGMYHGETLIEAVYNLLLEVLNERKD